MNYGVLVLGATISISLFLRICAGAVSNTNIYLPQDTRTDIYEDLKYNPTVYGWVTKNKFYEVEQFIREIWHENLYGTYDYSKIDEQATEFIKVIRPWESSKRKVAEKLTKLNAPVIAKTDVCEMDWKSSEIESQLDWTDDPLGNDPPSDENEQIIDVEGCSYIEYGKKLYCGDKSLSDMPKIPTSDLVEFSLVSTKVDYVPKFTFGNRSIQHIVLKDNKLKYIDSETFAHIKDLSTLSIIHNELDFISREFFAGLTDTSYLSLSNNLISFRKFENCTEKDLDEIPAILLNLRFFLLDNNPLEIIPKQMFAGMRESPLNALYLINCRLTDVHPEAFSYLRNLTNLNLSENPKLNIIKAFQGLIGTHLERLDLSSNNLLEVNKEALTIVADTLVYLNLANNFFSAITENTFPTMKELTNLDLTNCRLDSIEKGALDKMAKLEKLFLSENKLKMVPASITNLKNLNYLDLNNNNAQVFSIERGVFANLSKLQTLHLSDLNLCYIQHDTFNGLSSLGNLFMDNVNVETIEDYAFADLKLLKILSLRGSFSKSTAEFNSLTFYGLDKLMTLFLERNNISLFNPEKVPSSDVPVYSSDLRKGNKTDSMIQRKRDFASPFKYLNNLVHLHLSDNKIEDLFPEIFIGMDSLKNVSFERNNIQSWQKRIFPNGTSVELFHLNKNNIGPVTTEMLEDFMEIEKVDLSENSFLCAQGACELKEMVEDANVTLVNWERTSNYRCVDLSTNTYYNMESLPTDVCHKAEINPTAPPPGLGDPKLPFTEEIGSNIIITIGIVCFCGIFVMTAIVTGYRKRVHLKYFWFVVKFNVMKMPEKAKMAVTEVFSYNYDIFISYHNDDSKFVKEFFLPEIENGPGSSLNQDKYDEKEKPEVKVCFHERDFEVGVPITENILECVDRSRKVVVLVSKKYLESQWCVFEMKLAYHRLIEARRKSFLIILMEDIPNELKTKVLNYLMKSRTYLEWPGIDSSSQEQKNFWNRLRHSIKSSD